MYHCCKNWDNLKCMNYFVINSTLKTLPISLKYFSALILSSGDKWLVIWKFSDIKQYSLMSEGQCTILVSVSLLYPIRNVWLWDWVPAHLFNNSKYNSQCYFGMKLKMILISRYTWFYLARIKWVAIYITVVIRGAD